MNKRTKIGIIGCGWIAEKMAITLQGMEKVEAYAIASRSMTKAKDFADKWHFTKAYGSYEEMLDDEKVDLVYIATPHLCHYMQAKHALEHGRHVLCETPLVLDKGQAEELYALAEERRLGLLEANKTAFSPAFNRLVSLVKSGVVGEVVSIDASESKLWDETRLKRELDPEQAGGSLYEMGSYPLLPIIRLLGVNYKDINIFSRINDKGVDVYTRGIVRYDKAVASFQLGLGVKTEGNLVISGTRGYVYVPSPWWKTDYFELRYEDQNLNRKYFYSWDEPGLRYEIQEFVSCIVNSRPTSARLSPKESICMAGVMQQFTERKNLFEI